MAIVARCPTMLSGECLAACKAQLRRINGFSAAHSVQQSSCQTSGLLQASLMTVKCVNEAALIFLTQQQLQQWQYTGNPLTHTELKATADTHLHICMRICM